MPIRRTVVAGDSVIRYSDEHGHFPATIWNDVENAELRGLRPDMNVLMPGDVVVIPDLRERIEKRPAGAKHRFRRKGIPACFRVQLFDGNIARANQPFKLIVDGDEQSGQTDAQGIVTCFVSARAKQGDLEVGKPPNQVRLVLQFGHLEPIGEVSGIQHRLTNLGYDCGDADGVWNEQTKQALIDFQRNHGLKMTGELDAATKSKLEEIHDDPFKYPEPDGASG